MKPWIAHQGGESNQRCAMRVALEERREVRERRMWSAASTSTRTRDTQSTGTALDLGFSYSLELFLKGSELTCL